MEQVPQALLMSYVLRGAGLLQVAMGIVIWAVASDVVRYRPIVITIIVVHLVAAPAFYLMDATIGMPRWWCLMDFMCGVLSGGIPLIFCLWPAKASPKRITPRWSQRRLPLEFMDGLSYTTIIEFAEPLARRRGSALDR